MLSRSVIPQGCQGADLRALGCEFIGRVISQTVRKVERPQALAPGIWLRVIPQVRDIRSATAGRHYVKRLVVALPTDISEHISATFAAGERAGAERLLTHAVIEDGTAPEPRLMRCALFASAGSLETLKHFVQLLRIDWRDVIVAGEYEQRGSELVRVRDLNEPLPARA